MILTLLQSGALIASYFPTGAESLGVRRHHGTSGANRQSPLGLFPSQPTPRHYDRVVGVLRTRHYSLRTEQTYWIVRSSEEHDKKTLHPSVFSRPAASVAI